MADLDNLLRKAEKRVDQAELYHEKSSHLIIKTKTNGIDYSMSGESEGYSLRVIQNGRMGFSFFTLPSSFEKALDDAINASKFSRKSGASFPARKKLKDVKGLYNRKLLEINENELADCLVQMIDAVKQTGAKSTENAVSRAENTSELLNSEGGYFRKKDTEINVWSSAQFRDSHSSDWKTSRGFFDMEPIAQNAADYAIKFSGGKPVSGEFEILLHPDAVTELLQNILFPALNSEKVFRKTSFLSDKLNKAVCPKDISILDDPLIAGGMESCCCDDEGVPSETRKIVDKGILKRFMFDIETAGLMKNKPGNGFKHGFSNPPHIRPTNLVIDAKENVKLKHFKGIFVYDLLAAHNVNSTTGDFALEIGQGTLYDGGMGKAIRSCSIVGNFFDLLKNVSMADDFQTRDYYNGPSWIYRGKIV